MTSRQVTETPSASQATDSAELLDVALAAAQAAAESIRRRAPGVRELVWRAKSQADFVSDVDTEAEHHIRDVIARRAPRSRILGEELSPEMGLEHGVVFVADPLDGTTNFLHGYPWYAVSVGVLVNGVLEAGVVVNVPSGDVYTARRGHGAFRNREPIRVSSITEPAHALVGTGFPFKELGSLDVYQRQFAAVTRATAGIRRAGSAALDLVDVALGRFEAFWELTLAPWDIAAGALLVREAGGIITNLAGEPLTVSHTSVVAGNPTLHPWLLRLLHTPADE